MSVLNDCEAVFLGAAWDFSTNSNAHIHDKTAFLLLRKELKDLSFAVQLRLGQGG